MFSRRMKSPALAGWFGRADLLKMDDAFAKCSLPEEADHEFANELLLEVRQTNGDLPDPSRTDYLVQAKAHEDSGA